MKYFSEANIEENFSYDNFIPFLKKFYIEKTIVPPRPHYTISNQDSNAYLLLMPSWQTEKYIGVKVVNVFPKNKTQNLPSVQGIYILMDGGNGQLLGTYDGLSLTTKRTAAMSAMACDILSRPNCRSMLMIGTGNLSGELIRAHCSVRPIDQVFIWGRDEIKASKKKKELQSFLPNIRIKSITDKESYCTRADIISVATLSNDPILYGRYLSEGTHVDLVGSFTPESRETDDECLTRSSIFVDNYGAIKESGDLCIPISQGVISNEDIIMDLNELTSLLYSRKSESEITLFKSVGNAKADLALAVYLYENMDNE